MKKISTGQPSTLKTYRGIAYIMSGMSEDSNIVKLIDEKIQKSKNGEDEEVIAEEEQVLGLFAQMILADEKLITLPKKYICMGKEVDVKKVEPIANREMFCKPQGGLWLSPYIEKGEYLSDWHEWCEAESFIDYNGETCSIITLKKDANIFTINSHQDVLRLVLKHEYKSKLTEQMGIFRNKRYIDFESVSKNYDAILLTRKGESDTRWRTSDGEVSLYGWDVASLLILNANCVKDVEVGKYNKLTGLER
ncbi:MAG: hypothetical protein RR370_02620 [Synergistaceae bacterium]